MVERSNSGPGSKQPEGSEPEENNLDPMMIIGRHLQARIAEAEGNLTPEAELQTQLFEDGEWRSAVDRLIEACAAWSPDAATWLRWMSGGPGPYMTSSVKCPTKLNQSLPKALARAPASVEAARKRWERARADFQKAQEDLKHKIAHNKALLFFAVENELLAKLAPVFAMGPAWTIMRAAAAHLPEEVGERATGYLDGNQKEQALAKMRSDRIAESAVIHETLDLFSGIVAFEEELRAAILKVCIDARIRRDELITDGRRPRSKEKRDTEVHPKAQNDAADVLDGLKRAG